jgi:phospholipid/cholesterol/gamma-HCH transport system permease protein
VFVDTVSPQAGGAPEPGSCRIESVDGEAVLKLCGCWRLSTLVEIDAILQARADTLVNRRPEALDGSALEALDTAAALQLCRWLRAAGIDPGAIALNRFDPRHERILRQVSTTAARDPSGHAVRRRGVLAGVGEWVVSAAALMGGYIGFLGIVIAELGRSLIDPGRLRLREIGTQVFRVCISALPVVALVTALIGLVFAYLLGLQAEQYGANIFVVDGVALGMAREFSPLLVAVIVAGRSGASFAAQLGTMRLNEETDAIQVLGMSAVRVLVIPRVLALVLTLPLLVFVGTIAGLAGAALIADWMLDIRLPTFISRVHEALPVRHVVIGLVKAPVFALLIAVIGCRLGLSGPRDTRTIGINTTSTVVQSIVGVILLDALFAVILQEMGL